jgi:transcription elongation factor Elf1
MTKDMRVTLNCKRCGKEFKCSPSHAKLRKNCSQLCSHPKGVRVNTGRTLFKKGLVPWNKSLKYESPKQSLFMLDAWKNGLFLNKVKNTDYKKTAKKISATQQGIEISEWKGFIRVQKYSREFYKLRDFIKLRDNFTCQFCKKLGTDIHHIDYKKENNSLDNLITLCHSCHSKTNYDRNIWKNKIKSEREVKKMIIKK